MGNKEDELLDTPGGVESGKVTPRELLVLGRQILLSIFLLFSIGMLTAIVWPNNPVFDTCKTILPPIATLVIGYYFGRND